jgi:hypothetical protein
MPSDPAPIITPYRVIGFLIAVFNGLALLDSIPPVIKPYLVIGSLVLGLAIVFFFNVPLAAPANPSIVARVTKREKKQG